MVTSRSTALMLLVSLLAFVGCMSAKGKVEAPELDPQAMAAGAMELCDGNGDGFIDSTEVKKSPALDFALDDIDSDGDGKISETELLERFTIYKETAVGLQSITLHVIRRNGDGLMGAEVRLVPEPFMPDTIEEAVGEVIDPGNGLVEIMTLPPDPGVRVGMYRVEVTSDSTKVPAKYNTDTKWGIEVPPITSKATSSPLRFVVK